MDHEQAFVKAFVASAKKARWAQFLSNPKRRKEILNQLNHNLPYISTLATEISSKCDFPQELERLLKSKGAGPTCHVMVDGLKVRHPPAEPGAFDCEPLEAAGGVANAAPFHWRHRLGGEAPTKAASDPTADPPSPDAGCSPAPIPHRARLSTRRNPAPRNADRRSSAFALHTRGQGGSRSFP